MDLVNHLQRLMAFSRATFGPDERRAGVIDHIRKELTEIEDGDGDPEEWVDVVILGLDGLWRSLMARGEPWARIPVKVAQMIIEKQEKNENRDWPDWRKMSSDKAIEHVRD